jgi:colanic acid/amylovoran biosynthesis glycosyltransferase
VSGPALVVSTTSYPYGTQEQFFANELPFLAERFAEVVLLPERVGSFARPLPANVRVHDVIARRGHAHGAAMLAQAAVAALGTGVILSDLRRRPRTLVQPRALEHLLGYAHRATRVYGWLHDAFRSGELDPTCTVFYSFWMRGATLGAVMAAERYPQLRVVSRVHSIDLYCERNPHSYLPVRSHLAERLDGVLSISAHGAAYFRAAWPTARDVVRVRRLGVSDPGFIAASSVDGVLRVASCSSLVPVKQVEKLVEALAVLGRRDPDGRIEWHHLGDGPERPTVEAAVRALPTNVEATLYGALPNPEVFEIYRRMPFDLFVNVSEYEGVPVSIMEAQSCGIPVLAPAIGGIPEIVTQASGALLEPGASAEAIAHALPGLAARFRLPAARAEIRRLWGERYDARANYTVLADELRALVEHGGPGTVLDRAPGMVRP